MIPLGKTGLVQEGSLQGWYIRVSGMAAPTGFLVARARNPEMDQTLIMDGIFQDEEGVEAFFKAHAPTVAWQDL